MSTGYTRQSAAEIIPSAVVKSSSFNNELNKIRDAFKFSTDGSSGHTHDGSSDQGSYIPLIADPDGRNKVVVDTSANRISFYTEVSSSPIEQVRIEDGVIKPVTTNDVDLGTSSLEFKNLYLDGTAKVDTLTVDENATVSGTLEVTGVITATSGLTGDLTGDVEATGTLTVPVPTEAGHATNKTYVDSLVTLSTGSSEWVSGGSFTKGERVWSPLTYTDYRAKTTHSGLTTDPSLDTTNWQSSSGLLPSNNLSDLADPDAAIQNLGITATAAELNYNDIAALGTSEASKVVTADANGNVKLQEELQVTAYIETVVALSGTSVTVDCDEGNSFTLTTSGNTTFTFDYSGVNLTTDDSYGFTLKVTAGGTHTLSWPASVDWPGGTAPDAPASGETDVFVFYTHDGGTNWYGFQAGDALA